MSRHSNLPPAQRVALALAVLRGTEKLAVLARCHQISTNTLRRWRDEFLAADRDRLTGCGEAAEALAQAKRLQKDLAEREMIIGELTVGNRFLQRQWTGRLEPDRATRVDGPGHSLGSARAAHGRGSRGETP